MTLAPNILLQLVKKVCCENLSFNWFQKLQIVVGNGTVGYNRLQWVTMGYSKLQWVTIGYSRLQ